jgi:hypothetical protein
MLDPNDIAKALELQTKTYGLLQWVGDAVRKGTLTFSTAHQYATAAESMRDWLVTYSRAIPGKWRPRLSDPDEVRQFVNLFVSYLTTSFDLLEEPGLRAVSTSDGCVCEFCRRLVAASHVKARKPDNHDRKRAATLKHEYLSALASHCGRSLSETVAKSLIEGEETSEAVALATYGATLIRRCHGDPGEPAVLSLWREFAWRAGSPRREFVLTSELVQESERVLAERLAG